MIGEALIEECLKHGISVCAVIRKDTARKERLPEDPHLELVECSLEELETLPEKVNGTFDTFYHIAWGYTGTARNKSVRLQSKNIDYTLKAVEAAAKLGCRRFIGAGSQAEYGSLDLEKIGPAFEMHERFPDRVNSEFIRVIDRRHLQMRVWERGSGETWACGTGATASAVASMMLGLVENTVEVQLIGGNLEITWDRESGHVYMTGPAVEVFTGEIDLTQYEEKN